MISLLRFEGVHIMHLQIIEKERVSESLTVIAIFAFLLAFGTGIFYFGESLVLPPQVMAVAGMPP